MQQSGHQYNAYEIKSSTTFHSEFMGNLNYLKKTLGDTLLKRQVIYDGESDLDTPENGVLNFRKIVF
jgi:hypothetical protein